MNDWTPRIIRWLAILVVGLIIKKVLDSTFWLVVALGLLLIPLAYYERETLRQIHALAQLHKGTSIAVCILLGSFMGLGIGLGITRKLDAQPTPQTAAQATPAPTPTQPSAQSSPQGTTHATTTNPPKTQKKAKPKPQTAPPQSETNSTVKKDPPAPPPITIQNSPGSAVSYGQTGGVTAGTINIGSLERHLTPMQAEQMRTLAKSLPDASTDWLYFVGPNDTNARILGQEIEAIFRSEHRSTGFTNWWDAPLKHGIYLWIASKQSPHFAEAEKIAAAFRDMGIPLHKEIKSDDPPERVTIFIGLLD